MNRLSSFLSVLALLGVAAATVAYVRTRNANHTLAQQRDAAQRHSAKLQSTLDTTEAQSRTLEAKAAGLEGKLDGAKAELTTARARVAQLEQEAVQTRQVVGVYDQTSRALAEELAALRRDLAEARASEASPAAVEGYRNTISESQRQLANASNGAAAPGIAGAADAVLASRPGRSTVLSVGPESSFVVLNFGALRGAALGQKLTISQGTEVIATVLINDVRSHFSIAHVLPATLRGVLHKGDSAVLLR